MSPPLIPRPFSQAWSLADSRQMMEAQKGLPAWGVPGRKAWEAEHYKPINSKLIAAIAGHLSMLAHSGRLLEADNAQAVRLDWKDAWDRLMDTPNDMEAAMALGEMFLRPATMLLSFAKMDLENGTNPQALEKAHGLITQKIEKGDFSHYDTEFGPCAETGARLRLVLNDWQPVLGVIEFVPNPDGGMEKSKFVPLQPGQLTRPGMQHITVEMPSGHLLVSDWFRIDAFTAITKERERDKGIAEGSSVKSFIDETCDYASRLGFVSVFGSSNVSVFQDGNRLVVGAPDANDSANVLSPLGQDVGRLFGSLRWTSVIDRQVLVDLLATKMGLEKSQAEVARWEGENASDIIHVTVKPGTYHLYCAGRPEVFAKDFKMEEVDISPLEYPMFVLADQPLTPQPVRARSPRR